MSSIPISKEGFQALEQELDRLKKERPHVIQAIKEAREEGDLKENAGYDAARERQGMLEARIKYIESRMALFNVIDLSTLSSEKAIFGATVTVEDADTGEEREFTLLGPDEADYAKGTHHMHYAPWTFCILTFGCKVNQYESQSVREAWQRMDGAETDAPAEADVILLNTCAVTANAVTDARQAVRPVSYTHLTLPTKRIV